MTNGKNILLAVVGFIAVAVSALFVYDELSAPTANISVATPIDNKHTDAAGQQALQEGVSIKDNTILFYDEEKGRVADGILYLWSGNGYISLPGDASKLSFHPFESSAFYYDGLEISDRAACAYQSCDFSDKVSYACDGPLVRKDEWLPASSAYCETDGAASLSRFEFSAANGNGFTTGGESSYGWYKLYLKKFGDTNVYFFGNLGETLDYGDTDQERVSRLSDKRYLDELLQKEENKQKLARWDELARSIRFAPGRTMDAK